MNPIKFSPKPQILRFEWPKHINRYFQTPLFPASVYFVTSREDFYAIDSYMHQRDMSVESNADGAGGLTATYETTLGLVLVIAVFDEGAGDILCHEVCHAAFFILEGVGHNSDGVNSEPFCYMAQWLFEQGEPFIRAAQQVAIEEGRLVPADSPEAKNQIEQPALALKARVRVSKRAKAQGGARDTR